MVEASDVKSPVQEKGIKIYPFTIEKLSEDNARYWFHEMEHQLRVQFSWQAIEYYQEIGNEKFSRILSNNTEWSKIDLKADTIIRQGLSPTTVLEVKDQRNAGLKWDRLKEMFLKSSNTKKAMKLMKMANWSWNPAINEKEAFRELNQLGEEFIDMNGSEMISVKELVVLWYLRGLGDKYATLRDTVMSSNATLDREYVLSRVEDLMYIRGEPAEKASRTNYQKGIKCFACKKRGHRARDCPNRQDNNDNEDDGQKTGRNRKRISMKGRIAKSHKDNGDMDSELEEYGGYAFELSERATFAREKAHFMNEYTPSRWCFDSGATSMSTGYKDIFESLDKRWHGTLTIASGVRMPIRGRGIVRFDLPNGRPVRLANVIYVPGLAENLLSLEALHVAGFESRGSSKGYILLRRGKSVAKGRRIGRSTYLDTVAHINALFVESPSISGKKKQSAQIAARVNSDNGNGTIEKKRDLIHRRLGHPGKKRFNNCVRGLGMDELALNKREMDSLLDEKCEICVKAKQVKNQSHKPVLRAKRPLQRVYMDFWGPNREGVGDEKYYLSLIDDCTRYSWVFIKKDRRYESVVYSLDSWLRKVERQSGKMLIIIRTDNAREFLALEPWADARGIEMEFIEADTPPQNGVAERFNRFTLEIARALLLDSGVSKRYWKYAIVTANYLRNRTILVKGSDDEDGEEKTPYELWCGYQPDLTHLRAWGCRVLYHHKQDSKLDSRVMEGTFLLYGKSDKQYLVLPKGGSELKLVTNPRFREWENGYLTEMTPTPLISMMTPATTPPVLSTPTEHAAATPTASEQPTDTRDRKSVV